MSPWNICISIFTSLAPADCSEREGAYGESHHPPADSDSQSTTVQSNDDDVDITADETLEYDYEDASRSTLHLDDDCALSATDEIYATYPSECSGQSPLRLSISDENIQSRGGRNSSLLVSYSDGELQRMHSTRHWTGGSLHRLITFT